MKKRDLKTKMVIELRNGSRALVLNDIILYQDDAWDSLETWDENLKYNGIDLEIWGEEYPPKDIVKVYTPENINTHPNRFHRISNESPIWERGENELDLSAGNYLFCLKNLVMDKGIVNAYQNKVYPIIYPNNFHNESGNESHFIDEDFAKKYFRMATQEEFKDYKEQFRVSRHEIARRFNVPLNELEITE